MQLVKNKFIMLALLSVCGAFLLNACGGVQSATQSLPPAAPIASDAATNETAVRFLENIGDYETAEKHYRDSLVTFPDYYRSLASLGRVRAAHNDLPGAIENYEKCENIA